MYKKRKKIYKHLIQNHAIVYLASWNPLLSSWGTLILFHNTKSKTLFLLHAALFFLFYFFFWIWHWHNYLPLYTNSPFHSLKTVETTVIHSVFFPEWLCDWGKAPWFTSSAVWFPTVQRLKDWLRLVFKKRSRPANTRTKNELKDWICGALFCNRLNCYYSNYYWNICKCVFRLMDPIWTVSLTVFSPMALEILTRSNTTVLLVNSLRLLSSSNLCAHPGYLLLWKLVKAQRTTRSEMALPAFCLLCGHLPVPLSMNRTLEIGRKLVPLSRSSSPPSTEQEVRLTDSMTGSSWAERWAEAGRGESGKLDVTFGTSKHTPVCVAELKQLVG